MNNEKPYYDPQYPEISSLIISLSNKLAPNDPELRIDYQQEAWLHFYRRINEFDISKANLSTFAYDVCWGAMLHYKRDNVEMIRKPGWISDVNIYFNKNKKDGEILDVDIEKYAKSKKKSKASIKRALSADKNTQMIFGTDYLESDNFNLSYIPSEFNVIDELSALEEYIPRLKEKEKHVLYYRFIKGLDRNEVAIKMNISISYVSYLEKAAINKLNNWTYQEENV